MIPRPETELLVEQAVKFLRNRPGRQLVCDLCTGCGCIAIAITKNFNDAEIIATDISDSVLAVAAKNIEKHKFNERIRLLCGDLFEPLIPQLDIETFDLLVCNPPYVSAPEYEKLDKCIKNFEPKEALYAGIDGLDIYRRICERLTVFLKPDAAVILEVGYSQGQVVKQLLEDTETFTDIKIEKDYHNNDRIVIAKR
jgi:release factor glutamine methyltransferase